MVFSEAGTDVVRAQYYDKLLKGFADPQYKFLQAVLVSSTSAWTNYFYRGSTAILAANTTTGDTKNLGKGIPRGAEFPQASISWERVTSTISKYGLEENIAWEDIISDEVAVEERTLMKIAQGISKSVDDDIWDIITENRVAINIQVVRTNEPHGIAPWNSASAAIIQNLLAAKQKIAEYNYPIDNLMAFISPTDYTSIMSYLADKGAQFPSIAADVATNGNVGTLCGIKLIVSNSVTASYAAVVVPKRCATWKELVPLSTDTKEDKFKSKTIRAVQLGITQLTDPKCVVLIQGTQ